MLMGYYQKISVYDKKRTETFLDAEIIEGVEWLRVSGVYDSRHKYSSVTAFLYSEPSFRIPPKKYENIEGDELFELKKLVRAWLKKIQESGGGFVSYPKGTFDICNTESIKDLY